MLYWPVVLELSLEDALDVVSTQDFCQASHVVAVRVSEDHNSTERSQKGRLPPSNRTAS